MCVDSMFYSGTQIWTHIDNDVTSNTLSFDFFTYQTNTQNKLNTPKLKFVIYSKSGSSISATLSLSELYKYTYNLKTVIMDKLASHRKAILEDKKYTDGFYLHLYKNNIYTTIMYNVQLDAPCIRFMIGEKESLILDVDKVYIPLVEFASLFMTLNNTFNAFPMMSYNITYMDWMRKFEDNLTGKISNIVDKIGQNIIQQPVLMETVKKIDIPTPEETESEEDEVESEGQSDFDNFLKEKRDTFELDLPDEDKKNETNNVDNVKTQKEITYNDIFSNIVLKKDFKNLQMIVTNCVNTELPVESFVSLVKDTCGIDLYQGISECDKGSLNYVINRNIKFYINRYIQKKIDFPKNISPIIVNDELYDKSDDEYRNGKIEIMYFLILSYLYLSKVKSQLSEKITSAQDNKEFLSYCLKTITSPFVFSYLIKVNKNILISYVNSLYYRIKSAGFFDSFEKDILKSTGIKIDVDSKYITEQLDKIYDKVISLKEKLHVSNFFNGIMRLKYKDFEKLEYKSDIIKKICIIEKYFTMNRMDSLYDEVKDTKDIPIDILKIYGITDKKYNNDVLIKYIQSKSKDFKDIEQIKNINVNVHDIIENINIQNYPVEILRALYFWDARKLVGITYDKFKKIVDDSTLMESQLISMLLDNKYSYDENFYNVFK